MAIVMALHHFLLTERLFPDLLLRFEVISGIRQQFIKNMPACKLRGAGSKVPGEPVQNLNKHLVLFVDLLDTRFEIPVPRKISKLCRRHHSCRRALQ